MMKPHEAHALSRLGDASLRVRLTLCSLRFLFLFFVLRARAFLAPLTQELFASESLPDDLRYLAIITVKNTLDRGWVKNITSLGENAIQQKDAEKKHIRARMLSMFSIPNIKVHTRAR